MKAIPIALAAGVFALALCGPVDARVTRIVIDEVQPMPAGSPAAAIAYEQIAGRAFGELDPKLPAQRHHPGHRTRPRTPTARCATSRRSSSPSRST